MTVERRPAADLQPAGHRESRFPTERGPAADLQPAARHEVPPLYTFDCQARRNRKRGHSAARALVNDLQQQPPAVNVAAIARRRLGNWQGRFTSEIGSSPGNAGTVQLWTMIHATRVRPRTADGFAGVDLVGKVMQDFAGRPEYVFPQIVMIGVRDKVILYPSNWTAAIPAARSAVRAPCHSHHSTTGVEPWNRPNHFTRLLGRRPAGMPKGRPVFLLATLRNRMNPKLAVVYWPRPVLCAYLVLRMR
jgi:hypothetical protein